MRKFTQEEIDAFEAFLSDTPTPETYEHTPPKEADSIAETLEKVKREAAGWQDSTKVRDAKELAEKFAKASFDAALLLHNNSWPVTWFDEEGMHGRNLYPEHIAQLQTAPGYYEDEAGTHHWLIEASYYETDEED